MHIVIVIQRTLNLHGASVRRFHYDAELKLHVYEKRRFTVEEFNAEAKTIFQQNYSLFPFAQVIEDAKPAETEAAPANPNPATVALTERNAVLEGDIQKLKAELETLKASLNPPPSTEAGPVSAAGAAQKSTKGGKRQ